MTEADVWEENCYGIEPGILFCILESRKLLSEGATVDEEEARKKEDWEFDEPDGVDDDGGLLISNGNFLKQRDRGAVLSATD